MAADLPVFYVHLDDVVRLVAGNIDRISIYRRLRPGGAAGDGGHMRVLGCWRCARGTGFFSLGQREIAGDAEFSCVDFHQHVVHHAARVLSCALGIDARTMRHHASLDTYGFEHLIGGNNRNGGRNHVAMQIEIDGVNEVAVGRDVHSGREKPESDLPDYSIVLGAVFQG